MIYQFKTDKLDIGFDFDVEFDREQKIYCVIGKNGIGKTQLLENMAKSLIYTNSIFLNSGEYRYKRFFRQLNINKKIENLYLKLPLNVYVNNEKIKDEKTESWGYIDFKNIAYNNRQFITDKPVVFIGAKNRGFTKNINPDNIKILGNFQSRFVESISRTMNYIEGRGLEQEEIANWFVSRLIVNPSFVIDKQNKSNEVVTVLKLIEKLEPSLKLVTSNDKGFSLNVIYHEGRLLIGGIPLDKLSTGFVSVIKIFQEIVVGYGGWSRFDDLSQVDGIVFIDEIEPHFHISWQTKIIGILKEAFPNTTFYITTHSPLVLAGLKDGEAYELYQDENLIKTKRVTNIENYFLSDIVREFFGVDINHEKLKSLDNHKEKSRREQKGREFLDFIEGMDDE
jgi:predicted ATPase